MRQGAAEEVCEFPCGWDRRWPMDIKPEERDQGDEGAESRAADRIVDLSLSGTRR